MKIEIEVFRFSPLGTALQKKLWEDQVKRDLKIIGGSNSNPQEMGKEGKTRLVSEAQVTIQYP